MNLILQDMTAEILSLARVQRMDRNTVGKFFNFLEKVATKNAICDTPGNNFKIDESGIQVNNKPGALKTEKGSKNVHVLTLEGKSENITVTACYSAACQFLLPIIIFR